jgi:beta-lactamase regulating signal transducer with metallopeptidase domain
MSPFLNNLNATAAGWTERIWAVVWQSTILVIVVGLFAVILLRRSPPALRYWVWQILAIKILLMPFWSYAIPLPQFLVPARDEAALDIPPALPSEKLQGESDVPRAADPPAVAAAPSHKEVAAIPSSSRVPLAWQTWLLLAWVAIVAGQVARLVWQRRRLKRLLQQAVPAEGPLAEAVREAAAQLALRRAPQALLTELDCSPFLCGIRQPVIVVPRTLPATLNTTELKHVLLHELAHVQRRDLVWGWIGEIARMVYFFHPAVRWLCYRLKLDQELACDALAMAHSGKNAGEYAATLVRVVGQASEPAVFKTAAASAGLDGGSRVTP